jgi:hypothetical protein
MHRPPSRAALLGVVLLVTAAMPACGPGPSTDGAPTPAASRAPTTPASAATSESGVELPVGFPVLPGALREQLQPTDEPGTIARWSSDQVGPVAYDFYVDALPAAGYSTTGLYPGGAVAIIAFDSPSGEGWELVLTLDPGSGGTVIEVRRAQS